MGIRVDHMGIRYILLDKSKHQKLAVNMNFYTINFLFPFTSIIKSKMCFSG